MPMVRSEKISISLSSKFFASHRIEFVVSIFSYERSLATDAAYWMTFTGTFFPRTWHNLCSLQIVMG